MSFIVMKRRYHFITLPRTHCRTSAVGQTTVIRAESINGPFLMIGTRAAKSETFLYYLMNW